MSNIIVAQIRRISDGRLLRINPDKTYSFINDRNGKFADGSICKTNHSASYHKYKYSHLMDNLHYAKYGSLFEAYKFAVNKSGEMIREFKIEEYIEKFLFDMVVKFIDNEDKKVYIENCFNRLCLNIEEQYQGKKGEIVEAAWTYDKNYIFNIALYKSDILMDIYSSNLKELRRDYKIKKIIE